MTYQQCCSRGVNYLIIGTERLRHQVTSEVQTPQPSNENFFRMSGLMITGIIHSVVMTLQLLSEIE